MLTGLRPSVGTPALPGGSCMTTALKRSLFIVGILGLTVSAAFAQSGALKVTSFPSGAEVIVDGVNTGKVTPMSVSLPVGDHSVMVTIPNSGWTPDSRIVTIASGNN